MVTKQYLIYSGYTNNELVGIIHSDDKENLVCEVLIPDDRYDFPIDLLGPHRDWERDDTLTIRRWLESRVIPPTRQFLRQMLDEYKIPEWDLDTLIKLNNGKSVNDKFSVKLEEIHNE